MHVYETLSSEDALKLVNGIQSNVLSLIILSAVL